MASRRIKQAEMDRCIKSTIAIKQLDYNVQIRKFGTLMTQNFYFDNPHTHFNIVIPRGGKRHIVSTHITGNYKITTIYKNHIVLFDVEQALNTQWEYKILQPPEHETIKVTIIYAIVVKYHSETRTDLPAVKVPVIINVECIYDNVIIEIWNQKKLTHQQNIDQKLEYTTQTSCILVIKYDEIINVGKSSLITPSGEITYIDDSKAIPNTPRTRIVTNPLIRQPTLRHIIEPLPAYDETSSQIDLLLAHVICDIYNNKQPNAVHPYIDWFRVGEDIKLTGYNAVYMCT